MNNRKGDIKMKENGGQVNMETFNYGKALDLLKLGHKVSTTRWGTEGKIYVQKAVVDVDTIVLLLKDTVRDKMVVFTPSVENQLEDEWYVVDNIFEE